jgi:hypothetical protein
MKKYAVEVLRPYKETITTCFKDLYGRTVDESKLEFLRERGQQFIFPTKTKAMAEVAHVNAEHGEGTVRICGIYTYKRGKIQGFVPA